MSKTKKPQKWWYIIANGTMVMYLSEDRAKYMARNLGATYHVGKGTMPTPELAIHEVGWSKPSA